jgi:hypothetical protein
MLCQPTWRIFDSSLSTLERQVRLIQPMHGRKKTDGFLEIYTPE